MAEPLEPLWLCSIDVQLSIERVCSGFRQDATLLLFDRCRPAVCVCCNYRGRHLHVTASVLSADAVRETLARCVALPDTAAEEVLSRIFDPRTDEERRSMEVL